MSTSSKAESRMHRQISFVIAASLSGWLVILLSSLREAHLTSCQSVWVIGVASLYICVTALAAFGPVRDIWSPAAWFMLFGFAVFALKLPLLLAGQLKPFFENLFYHPDFEYRDSQLVYSFFVFFIGYASFLAGYVVVLGTKSISVSMPKPRALPRMLSLLIGLSMVVGLFWFRWKFQLGVAGVQGQVISGIGYVYYPFIYVTLFVIGYLLASAWSNRNKPFLLLALFVTLVWAATTTILGWKSAVLQAALLMLVMYTGINRKGLSTTVVTTVLIGVILAFVITVLLFPIIGVYRVLLSHGTAVSDVLGQNGGLSVSGGFDFMAFWERLGGITFLVPSTASGARVIDVHLLSNLVGKGSLPETFLTHAILGVPNRFVTSNAPTSWGAFYLYGGIPAVALGMAFLGALSAFMYNLCRFNARRDLRWVALYAVFMVFVYYPIVFEGTVVADVTHDLTMMFVAFVLVSVFFNPGLGRQKDLSQRNDAD